MNVIEQLASYSSSFTPTDRRIYEAVLREPEYFIQSTTTLAASYVGVSQSAISRFCQKVGFESFGDFRTSLLLSIAQAENSTPQDPDGDPSIYLCSMIKATEKAIPKKRITELCDRILGARMVYTTGGGLSSPPAQMLSLELLKYNVPCYNIPTGGEMVQMHTATAEDLLIIFSTKNDTQRLLLNVLQETPHKKRPRTIMITHTSAHPLKSLVDETFVLPTWQTERYPIYLEPMTSMLFFCSLLMVSVSQRIGKDPVMLPPLVGGKISK